MTSEAMIPQLNSMKRVLYPHQLQAVKMMSELEQKQRITSSSFQIDTKMGIYADLIGYGKTLSIIALILCDQIIWNSSEKFVHEIISGVFGNGLVIKKHLQSLERINATLIICSPSIVHQWLGEIETTPLRAISITQKKILDKFCVCDYDVVICLPSFYNLLITKYSNYAWKRMVYDEPNYAKIRSMIPPVCNFLWLISSTPYDLVNKFSPCQHYLYNIFSNFSDTNLIDQIIVKNEESFIKKYVQLPPVEHFYHECYQPSLFIVKDLISVPIAEMISLGQIEKAIKHLGGSSTNNIQEFLCCHSQNNSKRLEDILQNPCNICLCIVKKPVVVNCCQNIFCGECFLNWMCNKNTCPMCRAIISSDMMIFVGESTEENMIVPKKTKGELLLQLLQIQGKYLIFSLHFETFDTIRTFLREQNISFVEIRGGAENRQKQIAKFKDGTENVLFLNSLTNGAGTNLQHVSDIIIYTKVGDDTLNHVIGRAYRIGRTLPLKVHHFV